jgi:hypothetical protein
MSFASFFTGFATQAAEEINKRDKEIREDNKILMESWYESRKRAEAIAEKRKEELTNQAKQLKSLLPDITDTQITTVLQSGQADTLIKGVIEAQTEQGKTYKPSELIQEATGPVMSPSEYIAGETDRRIPRLDLPAMQDRTAFGLRSTAGEEVRSKYLKAAGVTEEEATKPKGSMAPTEGGRIKFETLARPEKEKLTRMQLSVIALENAYLDADDDKTRAAINKAATDLKNFGKVQDTESFNKLVIEPLKMKAFNIHEQAKTEPDKTKRAELLKEFDALDKEVRKLSGIGKAPEKGEDKAPTRTDFFRLLKNAERTAIANVENRLGGATFVDSADGRMLVKGIDPEARGILNGAVNTQIKSVLDTVSDTQGRVPQGMREALASFGIKTDKNGVPILGEAAAPSAPPSPAPTAASGVSAARAKTKTVVRTGTVQSGPDKGKKVIEYSDGTREIQ